MKSPVILAQTDTTVGFLSQNALKLADIKNRSSNKPFLVSYANFKILKYSKRVPNYFKAKVRRSKTTTYVVKSEAFRVTKNQIHQTIIDQYGWIYSTSANLSGYSFQEKFAIDNADIIIEDKRGLYETVPSSIIKLNSKLSKKLR